MANNVHICRCFLADHRLPTTDLDGRHEFFRQKEVKIYTRTFQRETIDYNKDVKKLNNYIERNEYKTGPTLTPDVRA